MRLLAPVIALAVLAAPSTRGAARPMAAGGPLSVGDPAPPFALMGSDGRIHKLSDSVGKQAVVLAWFAKAFTGG